MFLSQISKAAVRIIWLEILHPNKKEQRTVVISEKRNTYSSHSCLQTMCSEGTPFNFEGGVWGSCVSWKENWKLESVKLVLTKLRTFSHLISKVSLKFKMLKPIYTFKIIVKFVRFLPYEWTQKWGLLATWSIL